MTFRKDTERTAFDPCPRCGIRFLPATYPGALSRADNETEICSPCGTVEALQQFTTNGMLIPVTGWPTKDTDLDASAVSLIEQMTNITR